MNEKEAASRLSILVACCLIAATAIGAGLEDYDVSWDSPSADHHGSMPLGNGDIGLNLWIEESGDLRFYIGKTDAWDDYGRLLKVGGVRIHLDGNPLAREKPFRQTLSLRDARVEVRAGEGQRTVVLQASVDANEPAIYVTVESAAPLEAVASIETWRTSRHEVEELQVSDVLLHQGKPGNKHAPMIAEPDTVLAGQSGRIGWYHHNTKSVGPDLLAEIQGLKGFRQADPLLHRTFGAMIAARGGERLDDLRLRSPRSRSHIFTVYVLTRHPSTPEEWTAEMDRTIAAVESRDFESRSQAHWRWWDEFWGRSWIRARSNVKAPPAPVVPESRHPVRVGIDQAGANRFAGRISRLSIAAAALSDAEIRELAGAGGDRPAPGAGRFLDSGRPELSRALPGSEGWTFERGLTVEAWVEPEALTGGGARIADRITPGGSDGFLLDTFPGNSLRFICGEVILQKENALPAGRWTHVAAVADPREGAFRLYLDGKRVAESSSGAVGDAASLVSRMVHLQRFVNACAGRGAYPIKFNGSIFTVPPPGGADPDYRRWGPGYWWQNTRLPYYGMCASGDFDLMEPLFRMYAGEVLELSKHRTRLYTGHDGAFIPECIYFWGPIFSETYGWTPFEARADKLQESGWHKWEWVSGLELAWLMLERFDHTLDEVFLKNVAVPFAHEVLTFFDRHYKTDGAGKLVMRPSQALETWWECTNPMPEIAGCAAVTERLLALPPGLVPPAERELWQALHEKLPPLPLREVAGRKALAPAASFARTQNIENPELYAVFPFRLIALGRPNIEWGLAALEQRGDRGNSGWRQDDIFMAYLGLAGEAAKSLAGRARSHDPGSRFPAFWGPNYDWIPDQDHGGVLIKTFQSMLLQTDGRKVLLFPAWPPEWDVSFKLHAPYRTVIEGEYRDGKLASLKVDPEERRADVEVLIPK